MYISNRSYERVWMITNIYRQWHAVNVYSAHCETGYIFFSIESDDIRDNIYVIHGTIKKYDLLDNI